MSKNTKLILNYPNYQNIIIQYLNLEEFKEKANDTMRSKRITITALCNYLGDNGLESIEICQRHCNIPPIPCLLLRLQGLTHPFVMGIRVSYTKDTFQENGLLDDHT